MKKSLSIIVLLTLSIMILASCGNEKKVSTEDTEAMRGNWELVLYDMYGVKMLPADVGTQMSFEFKDNGKVTYMSNGQSADCKWEKNDELITIWMSDGTVSKGHTAVLEGDYFTLYWQYNDDPVQMIYARTGSDAVNPELYISENDVTTTMIKDADESNILEIMEKMTPEARDAFDLTETYDSLKESEGGNN